jgi:phosphohistidine phosphatase
MPKSIVFVRHAKSDWSIPGQKDFDRTLNQRGLLDAPRMGKKLMEMGISADYIIASPAERAKATAEFVAEQLQYDIDKIEWVENLYEASLRNVLQEINRLDDAFQTVLIFGHNPTFTHIAEYFTKEPIGNIPTCGMVCVDFDLDSWALISGQTGKMRFFIYPKLFFQNLSEEED